MYIGIRLDTRLFSKSVLPGSYKTIALIIIHNFAFRTTQVAYQYYICISPADGNLYISDSEKHQVRKVITLEKVRDPSANSEAVVGSGDRCVPGDDSNCGDEGPAVKAKLAHPKGKFSVI